MSRRTGAILAGVAASAFWGGLYPAIKVVMEILPPLVLLAIRLALAVVILWPFVWRRGGVHWPRRTWLAVAAVGALGFGFTLSIQFVGTHLSTASNGALITSATPAFVVLFGAWLLHERLRKRQAVALGLATVGVLLVLAPDTRGWSNVFLGNLALLLAAMGWALYSVLVRRLTRTLDTLQVSWVAILGGLPVVAPLALWQAKGVPWEAVSWGVVGGVLYVALFGTAAAMFLWNYAFTHLESGTAALTFFAQPVVGVLIGALWLGEHLSLWFLLGGLLIGVGLYLSALEEQ